MHVPGLSAYLFASERLPGFIFWLLYCLYCAVMSDVLSVLNVLSIKFEEIFCMLVFNENPDIIRLSFFDHYNPCDSLRVKIGHKWV